MDHKWEDITQYLYENINPINGTIKSLIDRDISNAKRVENIWIEFDMNEFMYEDPFYGYQSSTSMFKMNVELWTYIARLKLNSIFDLENFTIICDKKDRVGSFSNSLHFTVPKIKFGEIKDHFINVEMEYCLTNSDSYGMMSGTIDDHITQHGIIQTLLKIDDLILLLPIKNKPSSYTKYIDSNIYDLQKVRISDDLNGANPKYVYYRIPYRKPEEIKDVQQWWQFWK